MSQDVYVSLPIIFMLTNTFYEFRFRSRVTSSRDLEYKIIMTSMITVRLSSTTTNWDPAMRFAVLDGETGVGGGKRRSRAWNSPFSDGNFDDDVRLWIPPNFRAYAILFAARSVSRIIINRFRNTAIFHRPSDAPKVAAGSTRSRSTVTAVVSSV